MVPRQHESVLSVPPYRDLGELAHSNVRRLAETKLDFHGVSLQQLRRQTQSEILREASTYTSSLVGESVSSAGQHPLIVTGHQPELFHAGVWAKNFAVAGLAGSSNGCALNLIIDNDTVTSTRIRVPVGTRQSPLIELVPFDVPQPQQPWEEALIADRSCFQAFGEQIQSRIQSAWNYEPLVTAAWPAAVRQAEISPRLSDCLTAARVFAERRYGIRNLEVPMSRVCGTHAFGQFAAYLLVRLPKFHQLYNDAVRQYRAAHRLRSTTHPVPELVAEGEWLEAPFWIWRRGDQRRERPFARQVGPNLELRGARGDSIRLPLTLDSSLDPAAAALVELNCQGIRFRTRALTTTLFARLFLADLFIHGIGGAKYDAMTDLICEQFYGLMAPPFGTVSATVHLPLSEPYPFSINDLRESGHRIRDLRYNPERYLSVCGPRAVALKAEKEAILEEIRTGHERPSRLQHRRLGEINTELFQHLEPIRRDLDAARAELRWQLQANSVLQDREFSWCLHPDDRLISFYRREFPQ